MYCLDTNIVIDILRGDNNLKVKLEKLSKSNEGLFITPVTLCELYKGAYLHHNPLQKIQDLEKVISSFIILDFNEKASKKFGEEYAKLSKNGKLAGEFDLMIASIAKVHNIILITRDKKDFDNIDVKIEVW